MFYSNFEYVFCRLIRKFLLPDNSPLFIKNLIPYYDVTLNEVDPRPIVDLYLKYADMKSLSMAGKKVLEIGSGSTNSVGYELMGRCDLAHYWGYEPYACFKENADVILRDRISKKYENWDESKIKRLTTLGAIPDNSADVILSKSVLEHVYDLDYLFAQLQRILKTDGWMIHYVDYRDHFFKYPYHFLRYSESTWNRFLNPGSLPRWRVYDHTDAFTKQGCEVETLYSERDDDWFQRIKNDLHPDFKTRDENEVAVTIAALFVTQSPPNEEINNR